MTRIYDGRAQRWVETLLVRDVRQGHIAPPREGDTRWTRSVKVGHGFVHLGDEPCFQAAWHVNGHVVAASHWLPTRELAEQQLHAALRPRTEACPWCSAQQLYGLCDRPGFVCGSCGSMVSMYAIGEALREDYCATCGVLLREGEHGHCEQHAEDGA